jgi:hypothetical protein
MEQITPVPKGVRRLLIISAAFLLASMAISGINAIVTLASPAQSPYVPSTVGFEGQLADANGDPVADGNYTITFSLYSVESGGTALWAEQQTVSVEDGLYSVQLGSVTALDPSDFDGARWLGITVSGDSEMTPRIPISAVPFALNARQALGLQGYDVGTEPPDAGEVLTWDGTNSEWIPDLPGARTFPELNPICDESNPPNCDEDPQDFFENYRNGALLRYVDSNTVEVTPGEIMIEGLMRRNTTATSIDVEDDCLDDGGDPQPETPYYIHAIATPDQSTFDLLISASYDDPVTDAPHYLLGWLVTNGSTWPIEIFPNSVGNMPESHETAYSLGTIGYSTGTSTRVILDTIVPPNTLGTEGVIHITFPLSGHASGGTSWVVATATLGSTDLAGSMCLTSGTYHSMMAHWTIAGNGSTSSQRATWICHGTCSTSNNVVLTYTASEDSTLPLRLRVTVSRYNAYIDGITVGAGYAMAIR